jgi:hypothetical protein
MYAWDLPEPLSASGQRTQNGSAELAWRPRISYAGCRGEARASLDQVRGVAEYSAADLVGRRPAASLSG